MPQYVICIFFFKRIKMMVIDFLDFHDCFTLEIKCQAAVTMGTIAETLDCLKK